MIQTLFAITIGILALFYVVKIIIGQFTKTGSDPKCDRCPIPEIINSKSNQEND